MHVGNVRLGRSGVTSGERRPSYLRALFGGQLDIRACDILLRHFLPGRLLRHRQPGCGHKAIIEARNAWRVSSVDFDLAVGSVVPRGPVQVVPVPDVLVQIKPEWLGLLYFVYDSQIVIVDPGDMRIVAIVPG